MDEAVPCRQPDARELHAFLEGIELAAVAATQIEMGPLVDRLTGSQRLEVAGRPWWVGDLPSSARAIRTVLLVSGYDKVNAAHALTCSAGGRMP